MVIKKNTVFTPLKTLFDLSSFEKPISLFLSLSLPLLTPFLLIFRIYIYARTYKEIFEGSEVYKYRGSFWPARELREAYMGKRPNRYEPRKLQAKGAIF